MRFIVLSLCFVVGALVFAPHAQAARFTSDYLLGTCGSDEDGAELTKGGHLACQAYIAGVIDYHNLIRSMDVAPSVDFCVPETESMGRVQERIVKYLRHNVSQQGPFIATPAVALGLFLYYPCGKK